jgi:hypothetical protein
MEAVRTSETSVKFNVTNGATSQKTLNFVQQFVSAYKKPGITIPDRNVKCLFIDVVILSDRNILKEEGEKLPKDMLLYCR